MAAQLFTVNETTSERRRFYLFLVDESDGKTPETGEAGGQPQISKNGAAFANTSATLVAVGNGSYYVELTSAELSDLGKILVRYKSANTLEFQDVGVVLATDFFSDKISTILTKVEELLDRSMFEETKIQEGGQLSPLYSSLVPLNEGT